MPYPNPVVGEAWLFDGVAQPLPSNLVYIVEVQPRHVLAEYQPGPGLPWERLTLGFDLLFSRFRLISDARERASLWWASPPLDETDPYYVPVRGATRPDPVEDSLPDFDDYPEEDSVPPWFPTARTATVDRVVVSLPAQTA